MVEKLVCISCKKDIKNDSGAAIFLCPQCSKSQMVRCKHCREIASKFKCPECGFTGPN